MTVVGVAIFAANKLYQKQVIQPWNSLAVKHTSEQAKVLADRLSAHFISLEKQLKEASLSPSLFQALRSVDQQQAKTIQNNLLQKLPAVQEFLLLRSIEDYSAHSENFVAVDLLRQSNTGAYPHAAAIQLDGVWMVYIATPVANNDNSEIAGSLLASFPASALNKPLAGSQPIPGLTTIRQSTRGFAPQTIFSQGKNSTGHHVAVAVKNITGWEVAHTAPDNLANDIPKPVTYFLASLTGVSLLALAVIGSLIAYSMYLTKANLALAGEGDISPKDLERMVAKKLAQQRRTANQKKHGMLTDSTDATELYPNEVFRNYDIRGDAQTQITIEFAEALGKTLGTRTVRASQTTLAVAADGRTTSPELQKALIKGILSTGCDVVDFGCIPTPVFNFGMQNLANIESGVIVTASHNPASDNGFKIIIDGGVMEPSAIAQLAETMCLADWQNGDGEHSRQDVVEAYCAAITNDIVIAKPPHVVTDCANGVLGPIAPRLLSTLGCEVTPLYCDVDGKFPYHDPDPSNPDNLMDLIAIVKHENADLGLAFDGDGDRVVAITGSGRIVWPDELLMIFSRDLLAKQPGSDIVFDVKSTRRLRNLISSYGGRPVMCKTGHSNIRRKIKETEAPLGGEYSGHIFFSDRWFGFDDGLYAATRLLEIMSLREQSLDEIIDSFEGSTATAEIKVPVANDKKFDFIEQIIEKAKFGQGSLNKMDGLRVEFSDGWGLVRASNTSASLTLRFEADNKQALKNIQGLFREQITSIIPDITLPF